MSTSRASRSKRRRRGTGLSPPIATSTVETWPGTTRLPGSFSPTLAGGLLHAILAAPEASAEDAGCLEMFSYSTSSSICISTNYVEEIKELEAQVLSLKKDLQKRHEGKSALDKMLSVQQSPNDKSGLGFNSNNKNKSKSMSNKKKGQDKVKDPTKIVCFKCKVEGHHVRSCLTMAILSTDPGIHGYSTRRARVWRVGCVHGFHGVDIR
ncbi:hypothetical protein QYE76_019143 [Lolium multiflorum]|uniref:CCHC-type domain-containing protein n=1 Tax=Lolium multiflorum TaxID=4521 RepID=A0AAD8VQ50_LOLMU|nr:hypothetical protein QYE76_019143 [Lolium multiflorum]